MNPAKLFASLLCALAAFGLLSLLATLVGCGPAKVSEAQVVEATPAACNCGCGERECKNCRGDCEFITKKDPPKPAAPMPTVKPKAKGGSLTWHYEQQCGRFGCRLVKVYDTPDSAPAITQGATERSAGPVRRVGRGVGRVITAPFRLFGRRGCRSCG